MRYLLDILRETETPAPMTEWSEIQTGRPVSFVAWRGIGGAGGRLNVPAREALGRDLLLGPGIYVAPSRRMASKYGAPEACHVTLWKPFAVRIPPSTGWIYAVKQLDLDHLRVAHDGICIVEGRTRYREDIRQAVIFPEYAKQVIRTGI